MKLPQFLRRRKGWVGALLLAFWALWEGLSAIGTIQTGIQVGTWMRTLHLPSWLPSVLFLLGGLSLVGWAILESPPTRNAHRDVVRSPLLTGRIIQVEIEPNLRTWEFEGEGVIAESDVLTKVRVTNQGEPTAITSYALTIDVGAGRVFRSTRMLSCSNKKVTQSQPRNIPFQGLKPDRPITDLREMLTGRRLEKGDSAEGWLWFVVDKSDWNKLPSGQITVILTDAFDTKWPMTGAPPFEDSGALHLNAREPHA